MLSRLGARDVADLDRVLAYGRRWRASPGHKNPVAGVHGQKDRVIALGRFVMDAPERCHLVYLNGDRYDCRRANLRVHGTPLVYEEGSDTQRIQLPCGLVAIVDSADLPRVSPHRWYVVRGRKRGTPYVGTRLTGETHATMLHRLIMDAPEGLVVDHINGDTLDNRRANLRVTTQGNNAKNRRANLSNPGYKGVHRHKDGGWVAKIGSGPAREYLGYFATAEEAARAYNEAAKRLHGEFARLNVIPDP
jgi:hypothetical protein